MTEKRELVLNIGPQHPSTHGVFRVILQMQGETVTDAKPVIGYLHRGLEKLAEHSTWQNVIPLTDRLDYVAAMSNNLVYARAVEKLLRIEPPERAQFIRVIMAELSRIASHLVFLGTFGLDLGAWTAIVFCFNMREKVLDLFEAVCGQRMTFSYIRFGGVAADLPDGFVEQAQKVTTSLKEGMQELADLINGNEIFLARTKGVGPLDSQVGLEYGVSGPIIRASGVPFDLRVCRPYEIYDRLSFTVPLGKQGDCYDRFRVRFDEVLESISIIEQCLELMPTGETTAKLPRRLRPQAGQAYASVEGPRGEVGCLVVSDGSEHPYRWWIRSAAFANISVLPEITRGTKLADMVAILASIDLVMGEIDR